MRYACVNIIADIEVTSRSVGSVRIKQLQLLTRIYVAEILARSCTPPPLGHRYFQRFHTLQYLRPATFPDTPFHNLAQISFEIHTWLVVDLN